jgi:DNA oxidative demethylase
MKQSLASGAVVLRGYAREADDELVAGVAQVVARSPWRHMVTPGGFRMSVAMTNCGDWGWVAEPSGYRYDRIDPQTGEPWPSMRPAFTDLARRAAEAAGYAGFEPDACLVNRYEPGAKLSLHQDKDELDFRAPIVSVSLGMPATFLFGGARRTDPVARIPLEHGDVVVPLKGSHDPVLGPVRLNLTFRKAR